jgi:hypothetical protein
LEREAIVFQEPTRVLAGIRRDPVDAGLVAELIQAGQEDALPDAAPVVVAHDHAPVQVPGGFGGHQLVPAAGHDAAPLGLHDQKDRVGPRRKRSPAGTLPRREKKAALLLSEDRQTAGHNRLLGT